MGKVNCIHPDRKREARGEFGIWICELNRSCKKETSIWKVDCKYNVPLIYCDTYGDNAVEKYAESKLVDGKIEELCASHTTSNQS